MTSCCRHRLFKRMEVHHNQKQNVIVNYCHKPFKVCYYILNVLLICNYVLNDFLQLTGFVRIIFYLSFFVTKSDKHRIYQKELITVIYCIMCHCYEFCKVTLILNYVTDITNKYKIYFIIKNHHKQSVCKIKKYLYSG